MRAATQFMVFASLAASLSAAPLPACDTGAGIGVKIGGGDPVIRPGRNADSPCPSGWELSPIELNVCIKIGHDTPEQGRHSGEKIGRPEHPHNENGKPEHKHYKDTEPKHHKKPEYEPKEKCHPGQHYSHSRGKCVSNVKSVGEPQPQRSPKKCGAGQTLKYEDDIDVCVDVDLDPILDVDGNIKIGGKPDPDLPPCDGDQPSLLGVCIRVNLGGDHDRELQTKPGYVRPGNKNSKPHHDDNDYHKGKGVKSVGGQPQDNLPLCKDNNSAEALANLCVKVNLDGDKPLVDAKAAILPNDEKKPLIAVNAPILGGAPRDAKKPLIDVETPKTPLINIGGDDTPSKIPAPVNHYQGSGPIVPPMACPEGEHIVANICVKILANL